MIQKREAAMSAGETMENAVALPAPLSAGAAARRVGMLLLVTLAALALVTCFFSPNWLTLSVFGVPGFANQPELNRAYSTLAQIDQPFAPIPQPSNRAIAYRLLFPVIWHYLHLPKMLYLLLPQVGCVLALLLAAELAHRASGRWLWTFLATVLMAAQSWQFTSMGWLTYFDSWVIAGLLVVGFVRSRWGLMAACLLTPWIDERFLLALPVAACVRVAALDLLEPVDVRGIVRELGRVLLTALPYVVIRGGILLAGGDHTSGTYVREMLIAEISKVPWSRFVLGWWMGFRAAWVLVPVAVWLWPGRRARGIGQLGFTAVLAGTLVVACVSAGDLSRSMAMFAPAVLLGILLLLRKRPVWARLVLPALVGANLLLPASHVVWTFVRPIASLPVEVERCKNPPQPHRMNVINDMFLRKDYAPLWQELESYMRTYPDASWPWGMRAMVRAQLGDRSQALADVNRALELNPGDRDAYYVRGRIRLRLGQLAGAREDLLKVVELTDLEETAENQTMAEVSRKLIQEIEATMPAGQGPGAAPAPQP